MNREGLQDGGRMDNQVPISFNVFSETQKGFNLVCISV